MALNLVILEQNQWGFLYLGGTEAFLFRRCPAQRCCEQEQCRASPVAALESPWKRAQHSWSCVLPSRRCGTWMETPLEVALRWFKCNPGQNLPLSSLEIHGMGYGSTQAGSCWAEFCCPKSLFLIRWGCDFIFWVCSVSLTSVFISLSLCFSGKELEKLCALPHDKLVLAVISFSVKLWISTLKPILNTGLLFCLLSNAGDFPQPWAGLLFAL